MPIVQSLDLSPVMDLASKLMDAQARQLALKQETDLMVAKATIDQRAAKNLADLQNSDTPPDQWYQEFAKSMDETSMEITKENNGFVQQRAGAYSKQLTASYTDNVVALADKRLVQNAYNQYGSLIESSTDIGSAYNIINTQFSDPTIKRHLGFDNFEISKERQKARDAVTTRFIASDLQDNMKYTVVPRQTTVPVNKGYSDGKPVTEAEVTYQLDTPAIAYALTEQKLEKFLYETYGNEMTGFQGEVVEGASIDTKNAVASARALFNSGEKTFFEQTVSPQSLENVKEIWLSAANGAVGAGAGAQLNLQAFGKQLFEEVRSWKDYNSPHYLTPQHMSEALTFISTRVNGLQDGADDAVTSKLYDLLFTKANVKDRQDLLRSSPDYINLPTSKKKTLMEAASNENLTAMEAALNDSLKAFRTQISASKEVEVRQLPAEPSKPHKAKGQSEDIFKDLMTKYEADHAVWSGQLATINTKYARLSSDGEYGLKTRSSEIYGQSKTYEAFGSSLASLANQYLLESQQDPRTLVARVLDFQSESKPTGPTPGQILGSFYFGEMSTMTDKGYSAFKAMTDAFSTPAIQGLGISSNAGTKASLSDVKFDATAQADPRNGRHIVVYGIQGDFGSIASGVNKVAAIMTPDMSGNPSFEYFKMDGNVVDYNSPITPVANSYATAQIPASTVKAGEIEVALRDKQYMAKKYAEQAETTAALRLSTPMGKELIKNKDAILAGLSPDEGSKFLANLRKIQQQPDPVAPESQAIATRGR